MSSPIRRISLVSVYVRDQDRARDFYTEKLGFEVQTDAPFLEGMNWLEVKPPGAETALTILGPQNPMYAEPGSTPAVLLDTDDIEAAHAELRERGVEVDERIMPRSEHGAPAMFFFTDPDGNRFLVSQRD